MRGWDLNILLLLLVLAVWLLRENLVLWLDDLDVVRKGVSWSVLSAWVIWKHDLDLDSDDSWKILIFNSYKFE